MEQASQGGKRREALVVLGMHRSGTSAVARVANLLGFTAARNLMPVKPDNPAGFWEPLDVVRLNQRLLRQFDRDWDDPRPIDPSLFDSARTAELQKAAVDIIAKEFEGGEHITLKDPRHSRLIPFWHRVFRELGYTARYLFVYRNPVDVARSLKTRNGYAADHSQQLWLAHTLEALESLSDKYVAFLSYDELLARREAALGPALDRVGLLEALDRQKLAAACVELNVELRHSSVTTEGLLSSPDYSVFVKETYLALRLASQRPELAWRDTDRFLARWRDAWDVLSPARKPLFFRTTREAVEQAAPQPESPPLAEPREESEQPEAPPAAPQPAADQPLVAAQAVQGSRTVILHYHLFKNAGSSVDAILKQNFGERWQEREFNTANAAANVAEVARWISSSDAEAFSSHTAMFPLPNIDGTDIYPIVFVRHPVDRIRSAYDFERKQSASTLGARLAKEYDFAGYVAKRNAIPRDRQCRDFQCSRLAGLVPEDRGSEAERAKIGLMNLPFFGLVEAFDRSIERLEKWVKPHFPQFRSASVHANASSKGVSLKDKLARIEDELGAQRYQNLLQENAGDMALFEFAAQAYQFDVNES